MKEIMKEEEEEKNIQASTFLIFWKIKPIASATQRLSHRLRIQDSGFSDSSLTAAFLLLLIPWHRMSDHKSRGVANECLQQTLYHA